MAIRDLDSRPFCESCGTPVEKFTEEDTGDEVVFTAECHGQRERVRLFGEERNSIKSIAMGLAFKGKQRRLNPVAQ